MRVYDTETSKKNRKSFSWCQFKLQNEAVERENIEKFEASTAAVPQSTVSLLPSPVNIIFEESHL